MGTNFNGLRKTREILDEIEKRVAALTLPGRSAEKAFTDVLVFGAVSFEEALQTVRSAKSRVAVIICEDGEFECKRSGSQLDCSQKRFVDVIVSDRVIDRDLRKATFGVGEHPGALALKDLVIEQITGLLLPNPHAVIMQPAGDEWMLIADKQQKEFPGRVAFRVKFDAVGGLLTKDIGKGPIQ